MTFFQKTRKTGWYIGGAVAALMMILLAESSAPPRNEVTTSTKTPYKKDFRPILQNIKTIPEHLLDAKAETQTLLVTRLSGVPEPVNGPMAVLSQMKEVRTPYLDQFDMSAVKVPATWNTDWLLEIIRQDPSVDYAYKQQKAELFGVIPDDPDFKRQINLHDSTNDVDVDAPEAWAYTTGSENVVVAVLDSGFYINNPDLRPNLWVNEAELTGMPDIDDDNNGCVDDIHGCRLSTLNGKNLATGNPHGSAIASILASRGNDGYGITGVAWNIQIMLLVGIARRIEAYQYILKMKRQFRVNIRVVNYSAGSNSCNPNLRDDHYVTEERRLSELRDEGILFVQAIGNDDIDFRKGHERMLTNPSCHNLDNIIAVAGQSTSSHTRWMEPPNPPNPPEGSNYGSNIADLYAPAYALGWEDQNIPGLAPTLSDTPGTSNAAPHVAGAAALLWSFKPDLTVTEVRNVLLDTVDRFPNYDGEVASGGALNIANALYSVATPGIRIHSSQTTIAEGTSGYIDLSLTREPVRPSSGEVVVLQGDATPLSDADAIVTPSTLTFTSANWHIPQRMTVRAAGTSGSKVMLQVSVNRHLSTTHYEGIRRTATMTLQSDGIRPTLHIPSRIAEGDTATATIRFSDPLISTAQFTITATDDSTAAEGENYTLPNPITTTPGATSATFNIQTIEEPGYNGPDKTIHLRITTDNPHILREELPLPATLTIEDKHTPIMTITVFPRTITQSNNAALAPTATATIQLDRMAVSDVRVLLNARTSRRSGDISHLFNNLSGNIWPASATIVENATSTEIIIHSLDYDNDLGPSHWIRLSPSISDDAAARLGEPRWATLRTRDDDGDSDTYIRLRVFLEGAVPATPTDTIQTDP